VLSTKTTSKLGDALFVRIRPDNNTTQQNVYQVASILNSYNVLTSFNIGISLAQTVFIKPELDNRLYVADSPHIALAAFDEKLNIIKDSFISKGYAFTTRKTNLSLSEDELIGQKFATQAFYQPQSSTEKHFFENASKVVRSTLAFSNGKNSSKLHNSGGDFYLVFLPHFITIAEFLNRVHIQKTKGNQYDRIDDNCGHAVLNVISNFTLNPKSLSTQEALKLSLSCLNIPIPDELPDLFKTPVELGEAESLRIQSYGQNAANEHFRDYVRNYHGCINYGSQKE